MRLDSLELVSRLEKRRLKQIFDLCITIDMHIFN
jgi:hypothetical protein